MVRDFGLFVRIKFKPTAPLNYIEIDLLFSFAAVTICALNNAIIRIMEKLVLAIIQN